MCLKDMLQLDPRKRLSAKQLLMNPIFDKIRNVHLEKESSEHVKIMVDEIDEKEYVDFRKVILSNMAMLKNKESKNE